MRALLALEEPSGLDASDDLDFFDLTFFGVLSGLPEECEPRRPGIIHGPSVEFTPTPPLQLPPLLLFMSRPLRAFVMANMSPMLRDMGDTSPGIGG